MRFTNKGNLSLQPLGSAISGKVFFFFFPELDGRGRRGDGAGGTARLVPLPPSRVRPREPRAGEWGEGVAKTGFLGPRESGGEVGGFRKTAGLLIIFIVTQQECSALSKTRVHS